MTSNQKITTRKYFTFFIHLNSKIIIMKKLLLIPIALIMACNAPNKENKNKDDNKVAKGEDYKLVEKWESDSLLKVPESVLLDKDNDILYVSNVDGLDPWKADGKGSIAKLDLNGKIISAEWVKGMDAPKGMGMHRNKLYVADLSVIRVIDIKSGKIEKSIPIKNATGLNDITIAGNGDIYITDYQEKKLYRVKEDKIELLAENLKQPNGVLFQDNDLYVLDGDGMYKLGNNNTLELIVDGMEGGVDGIVHVNGDEFIVSCWEGALWHVTEDGAKHLLMDTRAAQRRTADIEYDKKTNTLFVPTFFRNTVIAYEFK